VPQSFSEQMLAISHEDCPIHRQISLPKEDSSTICEMLRAAKVLVSVSDFLRLA